MNRSMINFIGIAGGVIGIISVFLPWFGVIGSLMTLMLPMAVFLLLLYGAAIGYTIYNLMRKDEPSRVGPILLIGVGFITFFAPLGLYYASYVFGLSAGFYLALLAGGAYSYEWCDRDYCYTEDASFTTKIFWSS